MWDILKRVAGEYPPAAYLFIQEGLRYTCDRLHEDSTVEDASRHVSGQELCLGLRDYAITEYGLLARTVLRSWGIERTRDFGVLVFAMVEAGLLRKTEEDSIEDFDAAYDFDEAFDTRAEVC